MRREDDKTVELDLNLLHERHRGLTVSISGTYFEAACVCFSRHFSPPIDVIVETPETRHSCQAVFEPPDSRTKDAWANEIDATEAGAYGVSLATIEKVENLVAVKRAETLTGADYYLAPAGAEISDLEECYRLEVSGVDSGNRSAIAKRLREKIQQTQDGNSNLPAYAAVVGFKEKLIALQPVRES